MSKSSSPHTLSYSVGKDDIDELKRVLSELNFAERSDLEQVTVEITCEQPILTDLLDREPDTGDTEDTTPPQSTPEYQADPDPAEIDTEETLTPGTNQFKVAAILYRSNPMSLKELNQLLDNTPWDLPYKSISAALSNLKADGLITKTDSRGGKYYMTDRGDEIMENTVLHSEGYCLNMADKITGLHPSSNYDQ